MARSAQQERDPGITATAAWFCIHSRPKREDVAAAHLRRHGTEVYLPRIRFKRATRRGPVWFNEALFPNYLFARFEPGQSLRRIEHACGVHQVVHFGNHWPTVPDEVIEALRGAVPGDRPHLIQPDLQSGESVVISGGMFRGFEAVVTRVMPSRARVALLLEFLGTRITLELPDENAAAQNHHRAFLLRQADTR
jgi:transcriptional antiterminator RfaH